jgi:hypothetical protein
MRGLEEIKKINENPHAFHGESNDREQYGNAPRYLSGDDRPWDGTASHARVKNAEGRASHETLQRILEDITGGRPKAAADTTTDFIRQMLEGGPVKRPSPIDKKAEAAEAVLGLFALAALLDTLGVPAPGSKPRTLADRSPLNDKSDRVARGEHLGMEGILSAIDAEPPFLKFWQRLNDERAARGEPEAGYKTARDAFNGGPTPAGALTFIGKKWDGLRAVPAGSNYHGEFRQVTEDGTVWHVVSDSFGPRVYTTPEAALGAADTAKRHSEEHKS